VPSHTDATLAPEAIRERIDFARLSWVRPLVREYLSNFKAVSEFFAGDPHDPAAWRDTISRVDRAYRSRPLVASVIESQLVGREAPSAARDNAAKLRQAGTVAVVTGQQAGAFGGPLYTLLKAVSTIQLARKVEADCGTPVVPVFWVESEDHDWAEVRQTAILDRNQTLSTIALPEPATSGAVPVRTIVLDDRVEATISMLESELVPSEFTREVGAAARRRYRPGTDIATAFAGLLDDLLGPEGLVVFEAGDPTAKPAVASLFAAELRTACRTSELVRQAGARMAAAGHAPQIEPNEDAVCLFYMDGRNRLPIRHKGGSCRVGDTERSLSDLEAEASEHPERFSPNVLLRPLVQDTLFPNICYVAGPAELAYQAQLGDVYAALGVERPLLYPRVSATLVDRAAGRFLERADLAFEHLEAEDESALNRLLEQQLPPEVHETVDSLSRLVRDQTDRLKDTVTTIDPTLTGVVETTADRIGETLKTLEAKIVQASKKKDETMRRQFQRTQALAFPGGHPQERTLGIVFFLNRYGPALPSRLLDVLPIEADHHYVVSI
jgi:bacillithiol biosynthesis cysteine-adding enzyme BshC